jgi:hypothetical protein
MPLAVPQTRYFHHGLLGLHGTNPIRVAVKLRCKREHRRLALLKDLSKCRFAF